MADCRSGGRRNAMSLRASHSGRKRGEKGESKRLRRRKRREKRGEGKRRGREGAAA